MEIRKITIVNTRDQKRTTVETDATTLAGLKAALRSAEIDYSDMTFYEALSHSELLTDDAILPHDIPYKGEITNNLVFMLTNANKKIKSGAFSEARVALYNEVVNGGYAEAILEKYGKNFTNCSNIELTMFLEEQAQPEAECVDSKARNAVINLVDLLCENDYLSVREGNSIKGILTSTEVRGAAASTPEVTPVYSEEELDEIIASMPEFVR